MSQIVKTVEEMVPTRVKRHGIRCDNPECMPDGSRCIEFLVTDDHTGDYKAMSNTWLELCQMDQSVKLHFCSPRCTVKWLRDYYAKALQVES